MSFKISTQTFIISLNSSKIGLKKKLTLTTITIINVITQNLLFLAS